MTEIDHIAPGKIPIPQYNTMPELAQALDALLTHFEAGIDVLDNTDRAAKLRAHHDAPPVGDPQTGE